MSANHAEHGDAAKRQAQFDAAVKGGAKGATIGIGISVPAAYVLHQRWPAFRQLPLPLKAFFITGFTVATGVIAADKSGLAYEHEHYSDEGAQRMRQNQTKEQAEWAALSNRDKALTWTKANKFSVVAGSWIASMGGIFAYIHNQPMSFAQKLVQTRVWAQGLTLGSLLAMAAITQIPSEGDKILKEREDATDHSWKDFVGDSNAVPSRKPHSGDGAKKAHEDNNKRSGMGSHQGSGSNNKQSSNNGSSSAPAAQSEQDTDAAAGSQQGSGKSGKSESKSATTHNDRSTPAASSSSSSKSDGNDQKDIDTNHGNKSARSAQPTAKKQSAGPTKANASATGENAGYGGNN